MTPFKAALLTVGYYLILLAMIAGMGHLAGRNRGFEEN